MGNAINKMIDFIIANYQDIVLNTARIFSSVFEIMLAFILANNFYKPKPKVRRYDYIAFFTLAAVLILLQEYAGIGSFKYVLECIVLLFFLFALYKGTVAEKLSGAAAFAVIVGGANLLSNLLFYSILPKMEIMQNLSDPLFQLLKLTAANFIMIPLAVLLSVLKKNTSRQGGATFRLWISILLVPMVTLVTFAIFQYFIETYEPDREITVYIYISCVGIVFLNVLVLILFWRLHNQMNTKRENDILTSQLALQEASVKNLENAYNRTRHFRHDIKNHLLTMNILAEKGDTEELKKYLREMNVIIDESSYVRISGISSVDAILNEKLYEAQADSILTSYDVINMEKNSIKPLDMCIILSNALDNAIEANRRIEDKDSRYIKLKIHGNETFSVISVSNPTSEVPEEKSKNSFITSKPDAENHGFGLKSIESTAKKYKGEMICKCEDGVFTLVIRLNSPPKA